MKKAFLLASFLALPLTAFAQITDISSAIGYFSNFIGALVPFVIGLAVLLFLFGVLKYVFAGDNEEGRKSARQLMLWGIIMLFVMVSVWGLVRVLSTSFGLDETVVEGPDVPPARP